MMKKEGVIDQTQIISMSFVSCQIWRARNEKIYRNSPTVGTNVVGRIHLSFPEWVNSLKVNQEVCSTQTNLEDASTKEQDNCLNVRIFCEGAVNKEANKLGIGCIAYNNEREIAYNNARIGMILSWSTC